MVKPTPWREAGWSSSERRSRLSHKERRPRRRSRGRPGGGAAGPLWPTRGRLTKTPPARWWKGGSWDQAYCPPVACPFSPVLWCGEALRRSVRSLPHVRLTFPAQGKESSMVQRNCQQLFPSPFCPHLRPSCKVSRVQQKRSPVGVTGRGSL